MFGSTPNVAARLEALAAPGSVVVSDATRRLLRDRFELDDLGTPPLKGIDRPIRVWSVAGMKEAPALRRRAPDSVPLVGRQSELATMLECVERSRRGDRHSALHRRAGEVGRRARTRPRPIEPAADAPRSPCRSTRRPGRRPNNGPGRRGHRARVLRIPARLGHRLAPSRARPGAQLARRRRNPVVTGQQRRSAVLVPSRVDPGRRVRRHAAPPTSGAPRHRRRRHAGAKRDPTRRPARAGRVPPGRSRQLPRGRALPKTCTRPYKHWRRRSDRSSPRPTAPTSSICAPRALRQPPARERDASGTASTRQCSEMTSNAGG